MTTIELSTSIPSANINPIRLMMLMVISLNSSWRMKYIMTNVSTTESGMDIATRSVVLRRRRKTKIKVIANTPPRIPALRSCPSPFLTSTDESR